MRDDEDLRRLHARLIDAWNERDAESMAGCFLPEGVLIGFDGSLARGARAVHDHLAPIFRDHPTPRYVAIVRGHYLLGSAGLLLADVGMVPSGASAINPALNARQAMVATNQDGEWHVALFQNTPAALHGDEAARASLSEDLEAALRGSGPMHGTG